MLAARCLASLRLQEEEEAVLGDDADDEQKLVVQKELYDALGPQRRFAHATTLNRMGPAPCAQTRPDGKCVPTRSCAPGDEQHHNHTQLPNEPQRIL